MVLISVAGVAIGGVLIGLSTGYTMLVVLLALTAALGGGYHPASATAISLMTPAERRGRALGLHLIGGTSSFWVVLLVATPIAAAWTWRIPFVALSLPIIILGITLYLLIGRHVKSSSGRERAAKNAAADASGGPTRIQWKVFLPFIILTVGTGMIVQSVGAYNAFLATDRLGVSESHVILLMAITPFVGMFIAPVSGYLSDRFGPVSMVVGSALMAGPLLYAMSLVPGVAFFVPVLIFMGIANMARAPSSEAFFVTRIPARRRATILGIYFFAGMELAGVMTPLAGRLIDSYGFARVLTGAAIAQLTLAVVFGLLLWRASRPTAAVTQAA
jgi:MFS family permease